MPPGLQKLVAEDGAKKTINALFESIGKDRSPPARKKMKFSKVPATMLDGKSSTIGKGFDEEDSDSEDSNRTDSGSEELPKDKEKQESLLTDVLNKLYSNFDEDDIEMRNDILKLLEALKMKGCVTEREYADIKSRLNQQMNLNLDESIDSTIENMTREDEREILGLLTLFTIGSTRTYSPLGERAYGPLP